MDQKELQGQVLHLLENLKGMEPLKKLFWSTLNYDQVNKQTSRRGWPDAASSVLADDPTLLAAGGAKSDFQILYSRLAKDRLSLADERIVTSRLLKNHPYGLWRRSAAVLRLHLQQVPPVPYRHGSLTLAVTHRFPRRGKNKEAAVRRIRSSVKVLCPRVSFSGKDRCEDRG